MAAAQAALGKRLDAGKSGLSGLMTQLTSQYDQSFANLSSQLGSYKGDTSAIQSLMQNLTQNYQNAALNILKEPTRTYTPNLYKPNLGAASAKSSAASSLYDQATKKNAETFGWNPARVSEVNTPLSSTMSALQSSYQSAVGGLNEKLSRFPARLAQAGEYSLGGYNDNVSLEESLNQKLRQREQGILSLVNDMYSQASTFANQAENTYNVEKSGRLSERQSIQSGEASAQLGQKVNQAEANAAQQVTSRRRNTGMSFNPNNQLLSYLTRGY
jgi:hypothetical protein